MTPRFYGLARSARLRWLVPKNSRSNLRQIKYPPAAIALPSAVLGLPYLLCDNIFVCLAGWDHGQDMLSVGGHDIENVDFLGIEHALHGGG